jgi:exopolyphosphatase/guanosine-5'-triphosphate,3'-diphosphate pyrophosphatase
MAKITSIIDIGSNSMRMVVFAKTSRFAFHLINETKSKVKISQGAYENNGILQKEPMNRAFQALKSFLNISKNLKARKILCIATSALRDAPNKKEFLNRIKKELNLNIKIIDGNKEAKFGGIAVSNLLHHYGDFLTIDIGGGSTEFYLNKNNSTEQTISLKIGTVRIQELFLNQNNYDDAKIYILEQLKQIPDEFKTISTIVGLGGTIRALSSAIIKDTNYPFDALHGFTYQINDNKELFKTIINIKDHKQLKNLGIKKDRFDTIKSGVLIFNTIIEYIGTKTVITSGVGVREGLYLSDILRTTNNKFPNNFNVSVKSLLDRFVDDNKQTIYLGNNISKIFDVLQPLHNLDIKYKSYLIIASKLQQIGLSLNYYKHSSHSSNYILDGLSYGFSHTNRVLIAQIIEYSKKDLPKQHNIDKYKKLLPDLLIIQWLSFMNSLNKILNSEYSREKYTYILDKNKLYINSSNDLYIVKYELKKLKLPTSFEIEIINDK